MKRLRPALATRASIDERLAKVEQLMQRAAHGGRVDRMGAMATEQLATGGRRFRARLALSACEALGVTERDAVVWAAAVEILHNATLIHDDIQDEDTTRRGAPTLWVKHGVAQAINAGDFMLMLPLLIVEELQADVRASLCFAVAHAATRIVRGQADEMGLRAAGRFDWESYLGAAEGKTGALLALPIYGALRLAGRDHAHAQTVAGVFLQVGSLFQIQDDLVDLYGDKGRGAIGCDVYEGKVSALVIAQLGCEPSSEREVLEVLDRARAQTTAADVRTLSERFVRSGALRAVVQRLSGMRREIMSSHALSLEPRLLGVTERLVTRALAPVAHLFGGALAAPATDQEKRELSRGATA
jgi:geranylgeranyl diphosphate synthase type I